MKIRLNEKYGFESDNYCYHFCEYKIVKNGKKKGEEQKTVIGYYTTLESMLVCVPERVLMRSNVTDLYQAISLLKDIKEMLVNAFNGEV